MMKYSGYQYIQIDIANGFGNGIDKELFEPRIQWVEDNMDDLEDLMTTADDPFLYIKAVKALRDAQNEVATGHLVGLDQTASGMQIMGALAGCKTTCHNTGLIDPDMRADVYTYTTEVMGRALGAVVDVERADVKQAQMT
jgi:DNA-directed RNA polymerase